MTDAHDLARALAAALLSVPVDTVRLVHRCPRCGSGRHGVPSAVSGGRQVPVSLSRPPGMIAAAAATDGALGIDIERSDAAGFGGFAGVVLHPDERPPADVVAATRLWVRKEAVLKALGNGLNVDPRTLRLTDPHLPPAVLAWPDPRPPGVVQMRDLDAPDGYLAALATIGGSGLEYTQVSIRAVRSASV